MALRDRNTCDTNNTPRSMERGDGLTASMMNKLANAILRLVQGDGKSIGVNYVGGKAVISRLDDQIIPIGSSGGGGDMVYRKATKAELPTLSATNKQWVRGFVTGESGINFGPFLWIGDGWHIVPITYPTLDARARDGDFGIASNKGYMKVNGAWLHITHTE